jgi:sec-independent protein translocase protein TatB
MLDIGFLELMLIGVVGLLVLGPERLPKAARTAGMWIGKIKRTVSGMQREISAQLEAEELRQKLTEQQKKLDDSLKKAKQDVESIADAPSSSASTPAAKHDTDQRVASASARLDEALQTIRDETPSSSASPQDEMRAIKTDNAKLNNADFKKDSNHQ